MHISINPLCINSLACAPLVRASSLRIANIYYTMIHAWCRFLLASLLCIFVVDSDRRIPVHISYITAKSGGFLSSGAIPVVNLALKQINNRTDILPNYTLSYNTILDSKVRIYSYVLINHPIYRNDPVLVLLYKLLRKLYN